MPPGGRDATAYPPCPVVVGFRKFYRPKARTTLPDREPFAARPDAPSLSSRRNAEPDAPARTRAKSLARASGSDPFNHPYAKPLLFGKRRQPTFALGRSSFGCSG